ncbi:MAG: hypothetical protein H6664_10460 [Ardenticatenaceae bacterium]|nr:hypothetical protein [Ardenticatenaceae bacterium]
MPIPADARIQRPRHICPRADAAAIAPVRRAPSVRQRAIGRASLIKAPSRLTTCSRRPASIHPHCGARISLSGRIGTIAFRQWP